MQGKNINIPVFYDASQHRWKYYKRIALILLSSLVLILSFTILSVIRNSLLPSLNVGSPDSFKRVVSYVPKASFESNLPQRKFFISRSKRKEISVENAGNTYNPRSIGFFVNWDEASFSSLKSNLRNIDEIMPEWLHLSSADGDIRVDDQTVQDKVAEYIHQNNPNLPIVPLINNFNSDIQDWDGKAADQMLANSDARARTEENILNFIQDNKFSGIHIDLESLSPKSKNALALFMKEIYSKFHPLGLEVSQSIPLEDDPAFNVKQLASFADFLVIMAYDENTIEGSYAGPIASQGWYEKFIEKRFKELPSEKYVIAIGNYGYDWEEGSVHGQELSFQEAIVKAKKSQEEINFDPDSLNPTFRYTDSEGVSRQVWYLDAVTAFNQIAAGNSYHPLGYALWRLGSEDPSLWNVISNRSNLTLGVAESLQNMKYGYGISYEGKGEIVKVEETPVDGKREINYDDNLNLITGQKIIQYPSAFLINRWGGRDKNKIALTFDDGPDEKYTPEILDILKKNNVKAAFFMIGANASQQPDIVKRIFAEGHDIGNHTFTHPDISKISLSQSKIELDATESLLESLTGVKTLLMRPPYGEDIEPENPDQMGSLIMANNLGYYTVGMNIDPQDWNRAEKDKIVNQVVSGAQNRDGNVVLLHDSGGNRSQTVAALPEIIRQLKANGYDLVTVSELLDLQPQGAMSRITKREQIRASINSVTFGALDWTGEFISLLFIGGIILGMLRLAIISALAFFQWSRCRITGSCIPKEIFTPEVSVIIPAYNEEKVIAKTIKYILASRYPNLKVIAVDDGSRDSTYNLLKKQFASDSRVKIFTKPNGGKAQALNFGIEKSYSEIFVALDADTIFAPDTIYNLVRHFSDPKIGAVAGNAKVGNRVNLLTRWQALEYITSQNLDRRAFDALNSITVVPGSVGAWRTRAVKLAGGFSSQTLAEDADITLKLLLQGYKVVYDDEAIAYTEAPESIRNFIKQRFRWMYGTLQAIWKYKTWAWRSPRKLVIFVNIFVFQIVFPLLSPVADIVMATSIGWAFWQKTQHPMEYSMFFTLKHLFLYYAVFLIVDIISSALAFVMEPRRENWKLLGWILPQRFLYRQLMYYVAIITVAAAIKGRLVGWGKFERKASVSSP